MIRFCDIPDPEIEISDLDFGIPALLVLLIVNMFRRKLDQFIKQPHG